MLKGFFQIRVVRINSRLIIRPHLRVVEYGLTE
jgi:hypothetical protein